MYNSPISDNHASESYSNQQTAENDNDDDYLFEEVNDPNIKTPEELEAINKDALFIETLGNKGLQVITIAGDGNCLFRSISHQLYLTEDNHVQLRENCVNHLRNHKERFSGFIVGDFDKYIREMSILGTWGDEIEIRALEEIIDRKITIYSSNESNMSEPRRTNINEDNLLQNVKSITLSYHGSNHYNSVYDEKITNDFPLSLRNSQVLLQSRITFFKTKQQPEATSRKSSRNTSSSTHSTSLKLSENDNT
jgi:OTU domain-containing protein 5